MLGMRRSLLLHEVSLCAGYRLLLDTTEDSNSKAAFLSISGDKPGEGYTEGSGAKVHGKHSRSVLVLVSP